MSRSTFRINGNSKEKGEGALSWNGCDDLLRENIERSNYIKDIRNKITRRKFPEKLRKLDNV